MFRHVKIVPSPVSSSALRSGSLEDIPSLPEKWLNFSQGLRNSNHTQTLDLADIYGRFVYEDKLISRRYTETKKALITAPSASSILTAFFSNNVNKGLVAETFNWDEEEVFDDEEMTQVKVIMALANDELAVGKNHACNGEWIDITMRKRHIREPILYLDSGCSRSMTGVKSYLHKYVEQPGPKVVFGDNSSCITEGYSLINYGCIVFSKLAFVNGLKYNLLSISQLYDAKYVVQFDDKQRTIFNAKKEIVLIAPRRNDVYVLNMSSLTLNGACFFAKASKSDKPCLTCEKGKHHRASFKTKQNFSIKKCLHLLHMDLFGPVSLMSINHKKYTLVIVIEYSRYTWVHFLRKKSQVAEMIMSFVRMVENQNDVKVKQIRTDNGTEFRNFELESFSDEKGISQNFSSPYTPEQNGVAKRKIITLIKAARTMQNGSILS
ncbi:retrovirus-related pol polyprotein from transposon TNT 1-94 [Tanacetum coccineum]